MKRVKSLSVEHRQIATVKSKPELHELAVLIREESHDDVFIKY